MNPACMERQSPSRYDLGYLCTEPRGHHGDHVAADPRERILARWPRTPSTLTSVSNLGDDYTPTEARLNRIFDRLETNIRSIIMGSADDAVKGATEQLNKAAAEIDAEVQKLQDAGVSEESLAGLKSVSQSLDDRNPDVVVQPDPAPPVEESPGDAQPPATDDAGDEGE